MINSIKTNDLKNYSRKVAFKADNRSDDKVNANYESLKKGWYMSDKALATSGLIGILAGGIAKIAKKDLSQSLNIATVALVASDLVLSIISSISDSKKSKQFYDKYEKEQKYNNSFDKFIGSISTPSAIDFGDEEKNKKYYTLTKNQKMRGNKTNIISLGLGAIAAGTASIVCVAKKVPDKFNKIVPAAAIATIVPLITGGIINIAKNSNDYKNQDQIK